MRYGISAPLLGLVALLGGAMLSCSADPGEVVDLTPDGPGGPGFDLVPVSGPEAAPAIDGTLQDWPREWLRTVDPSGDGSGSFDVREVYAVGRGSELFVRFDSTELATLLSGPMTEPTLALGIGLPDGSNLSVDLRKHQLAWSFRDTLLPLSFVRFLSAPSHAAKSFELRVDLAFFGIGQGDEVFISLHGADEVAIPSPIRFGEAFAEPALRTMDRAERTRIRLATFNTDAQGLATLPDAASQLRLIRAVEPDILALQEIGADGGEAITSLLDASVPERRPWNLVQVGGGPNLGTAIASPYELLPIPTDSERVVGAVVLRGDRPVVVFAVHLPQGGYMGSLEDLDRERETLQLSRVMRLFRWGAFGRPLMYYADAPMMVTGTWNHVGAPIVVDHVLKAFDGEGQWWMPRHLATTDVSTWRNGTTGFPPGVRDLVLHDAALRPMNGFVLDTAELPPGVLKDHRLDANDSAWSDHLLVVTDYYLE
jgi:hypothetical protein